MQFGPLWSLQQEDFFADFWAVELPRLQALGWRVVVRPGFAHESVPVDAWHLILDPATGEVLGKEVAAPMHGYAPTIVPLGLPAREGSWLLSLGVEIDGQIVDLVPMLANLLRRDARWSDAKKVIAIDDLEVIQLRAPGGKRIDALAAPLKGHRYEYAGLVERRAAYARSNGGTFAFVGLGRLSTGGLTPIFAR